MGNYGPTARTAVCGEHLNDMRESLARRVRAAQRSVTADSDART
jgi:hypothetical protein